MNEHDRSGRGSEGKDDMRDQHTAEDEQARWQSGTQTPPPGTGWQQGPAGWGNTTEQKSVALATALSMMPGLGQIYAGFYQRGFLNIAVVAATITLLNEWQLRPLHPLLGIFLSFFWIYNMIDAARCAQAVNRALRGGRTIDLPELPMGLMGSSRLSGMILVAAGVLLLGVTAFGLDLGWIRDWWPVVLIVLGVRLVMKGRG